MGWFDFPLQNPQPDVNYFLDVLYRRTAPNRVTFIEYLINNPVKERIIREVLNRDWVPEGPDRDQAAQYYNNFIEIFYRLGYDIIRYEAGVNFTAANNVAGPDGRKWVNEAGGAISTWEDFEKYPWPSGKTCDIWGYEYISTHKPDGMGIIASSNGGIFEALKNDIMGIETLSYLLYDEPELVQACFDKAGQAIYDFYSRIVGLPGLIGFLQGDDMGHKTGTLISPDALRKYVLPWHKRLAKLCHDNGLFYCLHSCGRVMPIVPDLIEDVGIDGKHSYEDVIMPIGEFKKEFGQKIAVLGGVDVDKLSRLPEQQLRGYVRGIIDECHPSGGFILGSGNSIPDYVPMENYLVMLDEGRKYNK